MAGHSQFKNIMHRKGAQDKKRARLFARLSREIMVAAKSNTDPTANPRVRAALSMARSYNMPKDNIERAIKKASGEGQGLNFEEIRYEGHGPHGVAIIIEALTDNRNRTASELRSYFTKQGGNLGETGSVSYLFKHIGRIYFEKKMSFEKLFDTALEFGADHIEEENDYYVILCAFEDFSILRDQLTQEFDDPMMAEIVWEPSVTVTPKVDALPSLQKLLDAIENNDDVQNVFSNLDPFCLSDEEEIA